MEEARGNGCAKQLLCDLGSSDRLLCLILGKLRLDFLIKKATVISFIGPKPLLKGIFVALYQSKYSS